MFRNGSISPVLYQYVTNRQAQNYESNNSHLQVEKHHCIQIMISYNHIMPCWQNDVLQVSHTYY